MARLVRLAPLALVAAIAGAPVLAQDLVFTLVNDSGVDMTELYARPAGSADWEENILSGGSLPTGNNGQVTIAASQGCDYDLRMVFADGEALEDRANICENASYTINGN